MARHVGLRCGVPIEVPALAVNRLCGSGFQAVVNGAQVHVLSIHLRLFNRVIICNTCISVSLFHCLMYRASSFHLYG